MRLPCPPYFATWGDSEEPAVPGQIDAVRDEIWSHLGSLVIGKPAPGKQVECDRCAGSGGIHGEPCGDCDGTGRTYVETGDPTPALIPAMQSRIDALEKLVAELADELRTERSVA